MRPSRSSSLIILKTELGQMSVFLALIFQVLFVFFAMVINIGLLVHDKINLQNSVDLGAYYAAQKQAEILNEIAHLNYQIRQDYKLLAWRYWVLGTLGRNAQGIGNGALNPPATNVNPSPDAIRPYQSFGPGGVEEVPIACIANPYWFEFARLSPGITPNENYCWRPWGGNPTATIALPSPPFTPATAMANSLAAMYAQVGLQNFNNSCENASPLSWAFVATILTDYKFSISYKKKAIKKLRENLVSANPLDRDGKSIKEGVIATIERNLTESNLASFSGANVEMMNGLARGGCDAGARPGEKTLPEILTQPGLYFAVLKIPGAGVGCAFSSAFQTQFASVSGGVPAIIPWDSLGVLRSMVQSEPQSADDQFHSSLGFEKNPWCMAYIGVKTSTTPRKPFAPFGKPVRLVARSFAQPFGGRIGPWYSKTWSKASPTSDTIAQPAPNQGPNPAFQMNPVASQAGRTDPLTSPRLSPGAGGFIYSSLTIPNFSRFPGDQLGLRSALNQSLGRKYFTSINPVVPAAQGNYADRRMHLTWFYNFATMNTSGDALAFDEQVGAGAAPPSLLNFRQTEAAAVAPDLFDITYYSIDPEANKNYVDLVRLNPGRYGIGGAPMGDLGFRETDAVMKNYNVQQQILSATNVGFDQTLMPRVYWVVRLWEHLLTAWAPHRATNYSFPSERFGQCSGTALPSTMIPGKCVIGGRVGYSVRLIAREHLQGKWDVGGNGTADVLLNPPPDDTDF